MTPEQMAPVSKLVEDPCAGDMQTGHRRARTTSTSRGCATPAARSLRMRNRLAAHCSRTSPKMMFIFLPLIAALMFVLYLGSGRYYVEHLLFFVHYHAFFFVCGLAVVVLSRLATLFEGYSAAAWFDGAENVLITALVFYVPYYLYRAMRRVYGQGRWVTLAKFSLLGVGYLVFHDPHRRGPAVLHGADAVTARREGRAIEDPLDPARRHGRVLCVHRAARSSRTARQARDRRRRRQSRRRCRGELRGPRVWRAFGNAHARSVAAVSARDLRAAPHRSLQLGFAARSSRCFTSSHHSCKASRSTRLFSMSPRASARLARAEHIAREIKRLVRLRTELTASVGVAPNKLVAKIASALRKPDGLVVVAAGRCARTARPAAGTKALRAGSRRPCRRSKPSGIRTLGRVEPRIARAICGRFSAATPSACSNAPRASTIGRCLPDVDEKQISAEETFDTDIADPLRAAARDRAPRPTRPARGCARSELAAAVSS